MKIVFLINTWKFIGGGTVGTQSVSDRMAREHGFETCVITIDDPIPECDVLVVLELPAFMSNAGFRAKFEARIDEINSMKCRKVHWLRGEMVRNKRFHSWIGKIKFDATAQISDDLAKSWPDGSPVFHLPGIGELPKLIAPAQKKESILAACRFTAEKKLDLLALMAPHLDYPVEIFGDRGQGPGEIPVKEAFEKAGLKIEDLYRGKYDARVRHPAIDYKWFWGCFRRREHSPRIERSVIESIALRAIPILIVESTPKWFSKEFYIPIYLDEAKYMRPEVLAKELNSRISNKQEIDFAGALDCIDKNWPVTPSYKKFAEWCRSGT